MLRSQTESLLLQFIREFLRLLLAVSFVIMFEEISFAFPSISEEVIFILKDKGRYFSLINFVVKAPLIAPDIRDPLMATHK